MGYRPSRRRMVREGVHPTRERLIDITVELIGEVGIERVEMTEVLARAGLTTGALYHHFRDMADLLEEAMARRFPVGVRQSLELIHEGLSATTDLAGFQELMATVTEVSQAPENRSRRMERAHYLALAFGSESLREVVAQQQSEMTAEMTQVLREVQERGWLRSDLNPKAVAIFIQAYTLGRIIDDITDDPVDPEDWNKVITTVMRDALSTRQPD